jgi:MFS family permease
VAWVFFVNAVTFLAVVAALAAMRPSELRAFERPVARPRVREGLSYAWSITEIRATLVVVGVVGTLVYNFPTFLTLLARETFDGGAGLAGLLMGVLGVGTVFGALFAAHRSRPSARTVLASAAALGLSLIVGAAAPTEALVFVALVPIGALAVFFGATASGHMQLWSAPHFRGRVMAIYSLLTLGTTVVGGPFVGWVCQHWSPRVGLGLAGVASVVAAVSLTALQRREVGSSSGPVDLAGDDRAGASRPLGLVEGAVGAVHQRRLRFSPVPLGDAGGEVGEGFRAEPEAEEDLLGSS